MKGLGCGGMPCVLTAANRRAWRCISDAKFRPAGKPCLQTLSAKCLRNFRAHGQVVNPALHRRTSRDPDGVTEEDSKVCAGKAHHRPTRCTPKEKPTQERGKDQAQGRRHSS